MNTSQETHLPPGCLDVHLLKLIFLKLLTPSLSVKCPQKTYILTSHSDARLQ